MLGPDGKLWFTENEREQDRPGHAGQPAADRGVRQLAATFTEPFNITVGPDGKIWFSGKNNGGGGVGRMNPANPADVQGFGGFGVISAARDRRRARRKDLARRRRATAALSASTPRTVSWSSSKISVNGASGFNIRNLAPGPDGNVWVTDFGGQIAEGYPCRCRDRRST